ncbi:glycoside hydrolase family 6 protein [Streptomyces durbertensis]|uniref:Glucanase n=1 Tax=Streptomyces durbertensis TaxID=2448886 RepID=A0ABR6EDM7_9ACTN|nr:glycoside hydrolase family 6 protein [Streptomyces durbertensis]MBB1243353.1 glycoside hydrolase family 6 protein [Streptomyces durbertensis]
MPGPAARTLAALFAAVLLAGCGGGPDGPTERLPERTSDAKGEFWVDPGSDAARQVRRWHAEGRDDDARALRRIADRAAAVWPSGEDPRPEIHRAIQGARRDGGTVVLVAYNIPHRDCGQYSAGGAPDAAAYRKWLEEFAEGIGDQPALVVLEPDAVPHLVDGCTPPVHHAERTALLGEAVDRLKRQPRTRVYLDAGNPSWITDPDDLVEPLRASGMERADGFSLNVSNFQSDEDVTRYGRRLSEALDGKTFVIDSSRNGSGPLGAGREDDWCNPPGRSLGRAPTFETGDPLVDAYLWIKRPGESDGECRGGPPAGAWWPDYALGLARNAGSAD